MGSWGLLLPWIFLVGVTTATSAIITIAEDVPIFSFQNLPAQSFQFTHENEHQVKMCQLQ